MTEHQPAQGQQGTQHDPGPAATPNGGAGRPLGSDRPLWEKVGYFEAQLDSFRDAQLAMSDTLEREKEARMRLQAEHNAVKEESTRNSATIARLEPLVNQIHTMLKAFEGKLETLDSAFKALEPLTTRMRHFFEQQDRRQKRLMGTAYTLITLVASTVVPKLVDIGTAQSQHVMTTGLVVLAVVIFAGTFIPFGGPGGGGGGT